ncbi:MAG TPA: hypothetical protein VFN35_25300, partial [Ktedonobacteraceae bacterium]|nr:hypothetical protein [Ktedonobacteraceae bacterium]
MSYAPDPVEGIFLQQPPQSERPITSSLSTAREPASSDRSTSHASFTFHPWLIVCFSLAFLTYLFYLQTRTDVGENGFLRSISDIFVLFGSATCTLWCWRTARRLQKMRVAAPLIMARRAWIAWICLGGAALSYSIGQAIWTWYDASYASANLPFPAIYDPFYLLVYPLSWVGIALLIPKSGSAAGRTRLLLDAGIAVASALAISWYFLLGPTIENLNGPVLTKVVALAYPLGDFSLCFAAALLLFGPSGHVALNATLRRLAIGVTMLAITDTVYGYLQLQYTYHTGMLQDIGWPLSWLFIGWAATLYPAGLTSLTGQHINDECVRPGHLGIAGPVLRALTPLALALLTCALLILEVALRNTAPFAQVVLVCAGLFLLPVVRQALTLIDNMLLNERLRIALGQSQQAFQSSQQELLSTTSRAEQFEELRTNMEDLRAVHAALVRGDFRVRAQVQ